MAGPDNWVDIGSAEELALTPLQSVKANTVEIALSFRDGTWGALSNACNHVGGPLGDGRLDGDYIVCPWHNWKFHRCTGLGEPGFEAGSRAGLPGEGRGRPRAGRYRVADASARRRRIRRIRWRARSSARPGRCGSPAFRRRRWTTANPRFSGSDHLLGHALEGGGGARRAKPGSSGSTISSSAPARATTRRRRTPAPGPARSRRWTRTTRWTASTRRWCTGPTP